jgi:hypothetical protein
MWVLNLLNGLHVDVKDPAQAQHSIKTVCIKPFSCRSATVQAKNLLAFLSISHF